MHRGSICDGSKWAEVKGLFPDAGRKTQKVLKKLVKKHDVVYVCPPNGDIVLHNFSHQIDFTNECLVDLPEEWAKYKTVDDGKDLEVRNEIFEISSHTFQF